MYALGTAEEPRVATNAVQWAATTSGALLNTEWGATNDPAAITRQADVLDDALIPWMYWSYDENIVEDLHQPPVGDNVVAASAMRSCVLARRRRRHTDLDALRRGGQGLRLHVVDASRWAAALPAVRGHIGRPPAHPLPRRLHGDGAGCTGHVEALRVDAHARRNPRCSFGVGTRDTGRGLPPRAEPETGHSLAGFRVQDADAVPESPSDPSPERNRSHGLQARTRRRTGLRRRPGQGLLHGEGRVHGRSRPRGERRDAVRAVHPARLRVLDRVRQRHDDERARLAGEPATRRQPTSSRPARSWPGEASRSATSRTSRGAGSSTSADPDGNGWAVQEIPSPPR